MGLFALVSGRIAHQAIGAGSHGAVGLALVGAIVAQLCLRSANAIDDRPRGIACCERPLRAGLSRRGIAAAVDGLGNATRGWVSRIAGASANPPWILGIVLEAASLAATA